MLSKALTEQTSDGNSYESLGGSSDTWGASGSWSPDDFNSNVFYVTIYVDAASGTDYDYYVDHIRVTVYYTEASGYPNSIDGMASVAAVDGMTVTATSAVDGQ